MTIEVPTPSTDLIQQIETATIEALDNETAAVAAIREKFAPYAKHNGYIKVADYDLVTSNYRIDREIMYEVNGKRVRGLLASDNFDTDHTDQNRGTRSGTRLYLTEFGEWLEIERVGVWTQWQGEAQYWTCGVGIPGREDDAIGPEFDENGGDIRTLTDEQVAKEYSLQPILKQLGETMAEMTKKLPARYAKLQQRAELAQRTLEALKA